jgi:hypothetical protein
MKRRKDARRQLGVRHGDGFQRVVADAGLAADEQHADVDAVDERHAVVAGAGGRPPRRQPSASMARPICVCSHSRAGGRLALVRRPDVDLHVARARRSSGWPARRRPVARRR